MKEDFRGFTVLYVAFVRMMKVAFTETSWINADRFPGMSCFIHTLTHQAAEQLTKGGQRGKIRRPNRSVRKALHTLTTFRAAWPWEEGCGILQTD